MKKHILLLFLGLSCISQPALSDREMRGPNNAPASGGQDIKKLVEYLQNLGLYLGFDLTRKPSNNDKNLELVNFEGRQDSLLSLVNSFLGATPVSTQNNSPAPFIPQEGLKISSTINQLANATFKTPSYDTPKEDEVTVSTIIDQKKYQQDPVSQSIFNILTTPNMSYCMNDAGEWISGSIANNNEKSDCAYLYSAQVANNTIGELPLAFYSNDFNQPIISQLNSNSLIAPLMYSYKTVAPPPKSGLQATNQAQEAANFVRYAISDVLPLPLASKKEYEDFFIKAKNVYKTTPVAEQKKAQAILGNYLASLRVYAAQRSVAISNLYDILSKRMPQANQNQNNPEATSEALSEFTMAAWRLKNIKDTTGNTPNQEWLSQINKASSATVQKEIAVLLAEMNYQLYLNRQQQERILLTNTMILLQNMKNNMPSLDNSSNPDAITNTSLPGMTKNGN